MNNRAVVFRKYLNSILAKNVEGLLVMSYMNTFHGIYYCFCGYIAEYCGVCVGLIHCRLFLWLSDSCDCLLFIPCKRSVSRSVPMPEEHSRMLVKGLSFSFHRSGALYIGCWFRTGSLSIGKAAFIFAY